MKIWRWLWYTLCTGRVRLDLKFNHRTRSTRGEEAREIAIDAGGRPPDFRREKNGVEICEKNV